MVDYRKIIEGSRYATIFDRMDGGRGLLAAAQSFVSKAHAKLGEMETKKLSVEEQDNAVEPMVGTPITMVMSSVTAMEEIEDVVVDMPDYDKSSEMLSSDLQDFLKNLGIFDAIKIDMTQNLKEHLLTDWITDGMTNSEQLAVKQEINEMVELLGNTPEFENYVGHCIMATLDTLAREQLDEMGGIEDAMATDPTPRKDVTGDFDPSDEEAWKDSMREWKSESWKNTMRN